MRSLYTLLFAAAIMFYSSSCKKITEDKLMNGVWEVRDMQIDSLPGNYLNNFLHFPDGNNCCTYKLDFQKNGVVLAYYITYGNFNYIKTGTWEIPQFDQVTMKVDEYIDGTFDIEKVSSKHWRFVSEKNHVKALDNDPALDTTYTRLEMYTI